MPSESESSEGDLPPLPGPRRQSTWDVAPPADISQWAEHEHEHGEDWQGTHPLFIEMAEAAKDLRGKLEWREAARWIKYEESVEDSSRWSHPYVPSLNLPSLQTLRTLLSTGIVDLHAHGSNLRDIFTEVVKGWAVADKTEVVEVLCRRHVHLYETIRDQSLLENMFSGYGKNKQLERSRKISAAIRQPETANVVQGTPKHNTSFMRKIPPGAEACNILIGELECIDKPFAAFMRVEKPTVLGNITEVAVPTRFILVILAPVGSNHSQVGRAMGALMSDPLFKNAAYGAVDRTDLLNGLDAFLQAVTVLPPSGWDSTVRIEPLAGKESHESHSEGGDEEVDDGLTRTGKLFGGLIGDIKRKVPWYPSDFRDAFSLQCLATWLFLYFACLTPMITFGGILGEATDKQMGTMEVMVAGCICGVVFALFGGQPLLILGSTGPMLIFEKIIIQVSDSLDLNYMEFRVWIGFWVAFILILLVAFDASAFVRYITRFTEENFATLVACIFIYEAVKNLIEISEDDHGDDDGLGPPNGTIATTTAGPPEPQPQPSDALLNKTDRGTRFLLSILLFFGTFLVAHVLKEFRNTRFFPTAVRYLISDFAVVIAIILMAGIDYAIGVETPKLEVPDKFAPTIPDRGWIISPFNKNAGWTIGLALVPAALATILIFMDQQITAVILNRKDHKLKKGCGYHLDLLVLALLIATCSILGLPWFIAATVESLTNLGSLKMESESSAPGEKPHFLGVREQRVTNLLVFITVGLSVLFTSLLQVVPMPVLYGVFLFMGVSALRKMELFERVLLMFMPSKYQPDKMYLRHVPLAKVHIFTAIQVVSLAVLWVIKSVSITAIGFPLMLLVMMALRKLLEYVFTLKELSALDDLLPGTKLEDKDKELV